MCLTLSTWKATKLPPPEGLCNISPIPAFKLGLLQTAAFFGGGISCFTNGRE